ncbi:hypothetical protein ARMGADRAFT_942352, partial [Armillaria gallica]
AMYLQQDLSITGYGSPMFRQSIKAVSKLYALFSHDIGEKNMADIECMGTHQGFQSLSSSTRYVTKRDQAQDFQELLIPQSIDPHRYLSEAAGDRYVYTDDNETFYYERKTFESGERE